MPSGPRFPLLLFLVAACAPPSPPPPAAPPVAEHPVVVVAAPEPRPSLREIPVPAAYDSAVARGTRTASGAPGARYWQQRVRYQIEAELDPATATLRGFERIVYHNRSPAPLPGLVLNLYQNVFAEGVPRNRAVTVTGGVTLERVTAQGETLQRRAGSAPGYTIQGTLAALTLPRPVAPGDSAVLEIEWRHRVPRAPTFRTAWEETLGSRVFHVAQWYPQIATYDDLAGWDATPYLGDGEFYLEYGEFEVAITVPTGYLVGATGELLNAEEVLTDEARARLARALRSDTVSAIVTAADLEADNATQPSPDGQLTWRFQASKVRDFAFATSRGYVWDATRVQTQGDGGARPVAVHALYRPGAPHWERAARFGQHSLDLFHRGIVPYLYPQLTIVEGPVGGMEYPMLIFIGKPSQEEALYSVIAHEVAHQWFPMMVGTDEARHAWMDEGVATFWEARAVDDFYDREGAFRGDLAAYLSVAGSEREVPLTRHTDLVSPYGARTVAAYTKPAVLLRSLRAVLGDDTFDRAMTTFAREWLLKHPAPLDFFNTFERVSGRELDWFFHPWWYETGVLDLAVASVEGAESGTARVTVRDLGDNPAPVVVTAITASGRRVTGAVAVESWLAGTREATIVLEAGEPVVEVVVDPELLWPDVDRSNNEWRP